MMNEMSKGSSQHLLIIGVCLQVVYREVFLAGFDLSEDSKAPGPDVFNGSMGVNLTAGVHTVELMGLQCGKECYAISIAAAVTFIAGVYQVKLNLVIKGIFCSF